MNDLRSHRKTLGVKRVLIGGIWYDPAQWSGCATHVAHYLEKFFKVRVDQDLVGCESEADL